MKGLILFAFAILLNCGAQTIKDGKVIEITKLKPANQVTDTQMKEAFDKLSDFVQKQPGFLKRYYGKNKDGFWVDVVHWETLEQAEAAATVAISDKSLAPIFELFDEKSIDFQHISIEGTLNK